MRKYFNNRQAAAWLKKRVHFESDEVTMNTRFVKRLQDECRLLPAKKTLFGKRFTLAQLQTYAQEVKPR